MAYVKPGVEITQVNVTSSPTLIAPDLAAAVIAPAYKVVPLEGTGSYSYANVTIGANTVNLSGLDSTLWLDKDSVHVDLVANPTTSGVVAGTISAGDHLSFIAEDLTISADGATSLIIPSGLMTTNASWVGAKIYVGYRAMRLDLGGQFMTLDSSTAYENFFGNGQTVWDNPLPFALSRAKANTGSAVYGVATKYDDYASVIGSGNIGTEHAAALEVLSAKEVYALAPFTKDTATIASYTTHVETMSSATEKHERIAFISPETTWYLANGTTTSNPLVANKPVTATKIQENVYSVLNKRVFYVYPDVSYYSVGGVQVQKIKQSYINNMYNMGTTEYVKLAKDYELKFSNGTTYKYYADADITDAVWTNLKNAVNYHTYDVLIPMPGFFLAAAVAGQTSGQTPEQGFTNLPLSGPAQIKYSNDWFTESQLNTMVTGLGGAYLMVQVGSSVYSRHQLSTNATTVEFRELNITKSVDYVAKFIRNAISGYIGRSLISPAFLATLATIIAGVGISLVKSGRINSFALGSVTQDTVNPDTVRASITIKPKYPVNYIKIDLLF